MLFGPRRISVYVIRKINVTCFGSVRSRRGSGVISRRSAMVPT